MATLATPLAARCFAPGYAALGDRFVERRDPDGLPDGRLLAVSPGAAALVGLDADALAHDDAFRRISAGTALLEGMTPYAAVYAGHQFGVWAGRLGDGRAITLGEVAGVDGRPWEWQLKGAGRTAFSRFGDGRAVLRSSIREFLASEHLAALGVPTTRALALVAGDLPVLREEVETAAIVTRLAPSFARFGTCEYFAWVGDGDALAALLDRVIAVGYPEIGAGDADRYARFLAALAARTGALVGAWQSIGFEHGVLNTDNLSLLGLTLDYGPYGFLEAYDPAWVCNHTDEGGRYRFDRQPGVGLWNLRALAAALEPLVPDADARAALASYVPALQDETLRRARAKLGFASEDDADVGLIGELYALAEAARADHTRTFRALADVALVAGEDGAIDAAAADAYVAAVRPEREPDRPAWRAWLERYAARAARDGDDAARRARVRMHAPRYVLRNWIAQEVIDATKAGDDGAVARALAVLTSPYDEHPAYERWSEPAADEYRGLCVSCSS